MFEKLKKYIKIFSLIIYFKLRKETYKDIITLIIININIILLNE